MKCCRRSTPLFANSIVALLLWSASITAAPDVDRADVDRVTTAIETVVQRRLGRQVIVSVAAISGVRLVGADGPLLATPDPAARIGMPARFVLTGGSPGRTSVRIGE